MKISKRRSREMVLIDILTAGEFVYLRCTISRHSTRPFNFQTSFFLFFSKLLCSRHCHNVDFFSINRGLTFAILKFYYSLWKSTKLQSSWFLFCFWSRKTYKYEWRTDLNQSTHCKSVKWTFFQTWNKKVLLSFARVRFFYNFILYS